MGLKRRISSAAVNQDRHAVWNAFVDLLANSTFAELNDVQRHPHLVSWYDSEVQNGGHLQFFENRPEELITSTLAALRIVGGERYVAILNEAAGRWRSQFRHAAKSRNEYVSKALDGEFEDLDSAFYGVQPSLTVLLENYLKKNQSEFVLIEPNASS